MRPQRCGVGDHDVGKHGPPVFVAEKYVKYVQQVFKDFSPRYTVCTECYEKIKQVIRGKALRNKQRLLYSENQSKSTDSSRSSATERSSAITSIQSQEIFDIGQSSSSGNHPDELHTTTRSQTSASIGNGQTTSASARPPQPTSSEDSFDGPSTSAAAAARRTNQPIRFVEVAPPPASKRKQPAIPARNIDEDLSPNATNGTRLPHIQPIPKRRNYVTVHGPVMDVYLAGTTGG